jgi:hypothetical protein
MRAIINPKQIFSEKSGFHPFLQNLQIYDVGQRKKGSTISLLQLQMMFAFFRPLQGSQLCIVAKTP